MEVRIDGLRFLRRGDCVLDVPKLVFASGRTTALVGPNGAGKSTLLRLIVALERLDAGTIRIGGEQVRPDRRTRGHVAFAFQRAVFVGGSVWHNLDLALRLRGVPGDERRKRAAGAAAACGVDHLLDRPAHQLSGGEAQRVNLARALSLRAPVTLLDEPLSGLDAPARRQLLHDLPGILRAFATTTIIVTHDRDEALRLAGDLVVLIGGRVHAAGARADVFGNPPDAECAAFLGYTLIPDGGGVLAVAPRALRIGPGEVTFNLTVEELLDFGMRREVWGRIAGVPATVSLPMGENDNAGRLTVSAPERAVRRYCG
ncbi:MAG: ABC transporter ATP-binding protein [Dehalococcoidia bacterium]|nr:ABC transporter ATP-binding protein [Dehalococcoidia bacterium]